MSTLLTHTRQVVWTETIQTAWLRTGDLGEMNREGFVFLRGRLKEVCKRGGEQVALHEVDEALRTHPDVDIGVSFSVANPFWGEEIAAAVVLREGKAAADHAALERDIIAQARANLELQFKAPRQVWYNRFCIMHFLCACPVPSFC
jgi:acyl-CoA synthetase (AMP-forming)/AMP-acid ligase II